MDFSRYDNPQTREFICEVEGFLAEHWSEARRRASFVNGRAHDADFLRALGDRGWVLPDWPVAEGGAGLDDRRYHVLNAMLQEAEVTLLDVQMTRMVAPAVREHGSAELQAEVPKVAGGLTGISLGYTEPDGGSDLAAAKTRAVPDGNEWIINGGKVFTTHAHVFEYCFLLTLTDPVAPPRRGLTMFLVPLNTPGIGISALHTLGERTNIVTYSDVRIPDRYRMGEVGAGWQVLMGPLNIEHGLGSIGRPTLDPTVLYARQLAAALAAAVGWARQPGADGVAPSSDPAVLARLGAVSLALAEASATWGTSGRIFGSEALIHYVADLLDLLGPEALVCGHTWGGEIEHLHRNAQVSAIYGGTTEVYRNLIARELGLPKPLGG